MLRWQPLAGNEPREQEHARKRKEYTIMVAKPECVEVVKIANEEAVARKWRRVLDFGDWCQHPLFQILFLQRPPNKNPPDDKAATPRQK